jgi:hypothetical protein
MVMSIFERKDAASGPRHKSVRSMGIAAVTALAVGGAMMAATAPAEAHYWHHHDGGAVAAGVLGGLAVGAVVGSALAAPPPVVYEEPVYPVYGARYVERRFPACENFRRVDWRRHVWIDDFGRAHPCD